MTKGIEQDMVGVMGLRGVMGVFVDGGRACVVVALLGITTLRSQETSLSQDVVLATNSGSTAGSSGVETDEIEAIHLLLGKQSEAWNRGDLDAFMQAYWKSPGLTFSAGGATTRGWQATLERYRIRYPNREVMGKLTFSDLETEMLGDDAAMTLGRWHLDRSDVADGNFTLFWKRIGQDWRIIHDHSSSTPATKP